MVPPWSLLLVFVLGLVVGGGVIWLLRTRVPTADADFGAPGETAPTDAVPAGPVLMEEPPVLGGTAVPVIVPEPVAPEPQPEPQENEANRAEPSGAPPPLAGAEPDVGPALETPPAPRIFTERKRAAATTSEQGRLDLDGEPAENADAATAQDADATQDAAVDAPPVPAPAEDAPDPETEHLDTRMGDVLSELERRYQGRRVEPAAADADASDPSPPARPRRPPS